MHPLKLAAAALAAAGASAAPDTAAWFADVDVTSRVDFAVADYPVAIAFADLAVTGGEAREIACFDADSGMPVPAQLVDNDGDLQPDHLFMVLALEGGGARRLQVCRDPLTAQVAPWPRRAQAELAAKAGGEWAGSRYVGGTFHNVRVIEPPPQCTDHSELIRYEGPGWESDSIGYRLYLDWRNGLDIFGKRTRAMVLQDVGLDGYDSYHEPAEWGMDILKVGPAVGAGGFGAWSDGRIAGLAEVRTRRAEVTANGPLYAAHRVAYSGWKVAGGEHDLVARLGIRAGSPLTRVDLDADPPLNMAAGIVKLDGGELLMGPQDVPENDYTWLATWGVQSLANDHLGMAVFFRRDDLAKFAGDAYNHAVVLRPRRGTVSYALAAVWEQEPGMQWDRAAFDHFLERNALLLNRPADVAVVNRQDRLLKSGPLTADAALAWGVRLADRTLAVRGDSLSHGNFDPESGAPARWRYTTALLCRALDALTAATGDPRYAAFSARTTGSFVGDDGSVSTYRLDEYNLDNLAGGSLLLELHRSTGEERFRKAADLLWSQLDTQPRTAEGGLWHKRKYPQQMWLDGLYMAAPFRARYAAEFNHPEAVADIVRQFALIDALARDPQTGWLRHAYDAARAQAWADPQSGLSPEVWSRAVGWYAMALVDVLELLPPGSPESASLTAILGRVAAQITALQDPRSGLWYQVMDKGGVPGNYLESSASAMFVYALAKAVNNGWLPDDFAGSAQRGFEGLVRRALRVDARGDVSLGGICEVAGLSATRDGSFRYYMSEPVVADDPKGLGPFILSAIEMRKLLSSPRWQSDFTQN